MLRKFNNMGTPGNRGFIFGRNGSVFERNIGYNLRQGNTRQKSPNTYGESPFGGSFHANLKQRRMEWPKPKAFDQGNGGGWEHTTGSWSHSFQRPFQTSYFEDPLKMGPLGSGFAEKSLNWGVWGMLGLGLWGLTQAQAEENEGRIEKEKPAEAVEAEKHVRLNDKNFEVILARLRNNDPKLLSIIMDIQLSSGQLGELYEAIKDNTTIGYIEWHEDQIEWGRMGDINKKLVQNNKNYRYYPTDYVHVLLSAHAYENSKTGDIVTLSGIDDKYLKDWKVEKAYDDTQTTGYYGVIYVNDKTHQVVLASRGSESILEELFRKKGDWKTDLEEVMGGRIIVGQQAWNYLATEEAVKLAKQKGYNLSFAGHSLGGWLAELGAYYCHAYFGYADVKAVTFDSPGSKQMMEKLASNIESHDTKINLKDIEIVTYLAAPHPINSCNQHVGKVYRVNREMKVTQWMDSKVPTAIMKQLENKSPGVLYTIVNSIRNQLGGKIHGVLSIEGHTLGGILATFDPEIGKPKEGNYIRIADWPRLEYHGQEIKSLKDEVKKIFNNSSFDIKREFTLEVIDCLFSNTTIMSFISLFINIAQGKVYQGEYWEYFKHIDVENVEGKSDLKQNLSFDARFALSAKAHYREDNQNILKLSEGSIDKLLYELYHSKEKLDAFEDFPKMVKEQLKDLVSSFEVKPVGADGRKYELIPKGLEVDEIRKRMRRLVAVIPKSREMLKPLFNGISLRNLLDKEEKNGKHVERILDGIPSIRDLNFIERKDEVRKVEEELEKHDVAIICGFPGMGKTSLAAEYAHNLKAQGKQVRWVEAASNVINEGWAKLAEALQIKTGGLTIEQVRNVIYSELSRSKESICLILDNVDNEADLLRFLENRPNNVKVLVTTRDEKMLTDKGYPSIKLLGFTKTEAIEYGSKKLKNADAKELVEGLMADKNKGVRPLSLRVAVTHLSKHPTLTVKEYLKERQELTGIHINPDIEIAIKGVSEDARKVLKYCAYLDADEIPLILLKSLVKDDEKLNEGIEKLRKAGLISLEAKEKTLSLHREIQNTVKDKNKDASLVEELLDKITALFPDCSRYDEININTAKQLIRTASIIAEAVETSIVDSKNLMLLFSSLGKFYEYIVIDSDKSLAYYKKALNISRKLYPLRHHPQGSRIKNFVFS